MDQIYDTLRAKFPFMTLGRYLDQEYLGIMQNSDTQFVSMYCYDMIPEDEQRKLFLKMGETWWWGSNHQIPINVFLGPRFKPFQPFLKTFARKEFDVLAGPTVSLGDVIQKRIKRRQIQLIGRIG